MTNKKTTSKKYQFSGKTIECFFDAEFSEIENLVKRENTIFITDENIFAKQSEKFSGWQTIVIKAGEPFKNQKAVAEVINQLIELQADRQSFIVGIGGGVVTDITGFVASIYMRGVKFGFVPTSILAMVDASIGGKNGIDVGVYKNLVGIIRHPEFLLYDYSFLETLPDAEWINGFAEIIKHACIKDKEMFDFLEENSLDKFQNSHEFTGKLIEKNVDIKYNVVSNDEYETGERKLLNFGHTIGHAIENVSKLAHGHAISIGMVAACIISQKVNGFSVADGQKIEALLSKYKLPVALNFDKEKTWEILQHDKKKSGTDMSFVVLDAIGKGAVKKISLSDLREIFNELF
ncbi:MAG: 3-dehydroquinate synthase [Bacteroidota bacterium]|nr:3-dehydroquinate synthase [Bacteroidota bacterium]